MVLIMRRPRLGNPQEEPALLEQHVERLAEPTGVPGSPKGHLVTPTTIGKDATETGKDTLSNLSLCLSIVS
jgi:hypothetical protein